MVDVERERRVERDRVATALDRELRQTARAEAAMRLEVGAIARELLQRRAYGRLGFARLGDYASERLGISARALQSAAHVATRLGELLTISAAFARGELSWTHVRLLCDVASPADEVAWLARARCCTVSELEALADATRGAAGASSDPEDDLLDGESPVRLRIVCPGRVRCLWRRAVELARRVAGEQLAVWRAAEIMAAEGIAGRPADGSVGDRVLYAWMQLARRLRKAARRETEPGDGETAAVSTDPDGLTNGVRSVSHPGTAHALIPERMEGLASIMSRVADLDAFALDAQLRAAMHAIHTTEPRIGRGLRMLVDHHLYRDLGFRSFNLYVRERLGISTRKAWALVKVEKAARRAPEFADAYAGGTLSWVRALTLLPVLDRYTAGAWIARAQTVTVRRLADEVSWVLDTRDALGLEAPLVPPILDAALVAPIVAGRAPKPNASSDPQAHDGPAADAVGPERIKQWCGSAAVPASVQIGALSGTAPGRAEIVTLAGAAAEVCDAEICFTGPATVVALFRDALDVFERAGEPRWLAAERLLRHVIRDWEGQPAHRDRVFERDGWRCAVPACSGRRNLHDHHIQFRSRGGSNALANRITVCAAHHHHGIHAGVIRAWRTTPAAVHWQLGVRPDAAPLASYIGDRLLPEPPESSARQAVG